MKALLVDTNIAALPILESLISRGYDVTCIGNNSLDFMPRYGVDFELIDYSKKENLQKYISQNKFSAIIPGCNDVAYETCAKIRHPSLKNKIDPFETIDKIHNKREFRRIASDFKLSIPKVFNTNESLTYPLIVKPVDSFSGKGVTKVEISSKKSLNRAIKVAVLQSRTQNYIIEEYVDGQLYSYSCFLKSRRVKEEFVVEEISTANPFVVDLSRVKFDFPRRIKERLRADIERLAYHLDLLDGLVHVQFIVRGKKHYIIEVTRRCPGDLYSLLIQKATGFPYAASYAAAFLPDNQPIKRKCANPFTVRYTISASEKFIFRSIKVTPKSQIDEVFVLEKSGQKLEASPRGRVALTFFSPDGKPAQTKLINLLKKRKMVPFTKK